MARGRRSYLATAALCAVVLLLAGCGGSSTRSEARPSRAPAPGPSSLDPAAAAKQQVLAAYQGMFDAEVKALNTNSLAGTEVEMYASENQLANIKDVAFKDMMNNVVMTGQPAYTVQSVAVDLDAVPHTATVTLCFDNKDWTPINKVTGKSVAAPGQPQRYVSTGRLRTIGTRWVVIDGTTDRERRC